MDKEKVISIFKQTESLTAMERAFLGKKLMKSIFRDLEYENGLINDLSRRAESANKCIGKLTKEIEQYKAKEAFDTLKDAEQKLKESGGLGIVENETERHEWDRDSEGFNILKEFGCAAARNIDKAAMSGIENNDTKTSTKNTI